MRFSPRLLALSLPCALLLLAGVWQCSSSYAQRGSAAPDPITQLPAPPPSSAPTSSGFGTLGGPGQSATTLPPGIFAKPAPKPVSAPVPSAPRNAIRVGLSTMGSAIQIYLPGGATLRDVEQSGRSQNVPRGATLTFISGPAFKQKIGARTFSGPISVQINGRISQGWAHLAVFPSGTELSRVTSNGKSPRYGRPYRGTFELFPQRLPEPNHRKGTLALVNVLPLEDYLKGVVPWEMDSGAPLEALKAQAICARTKTLDFKQTGRFRAGGFDVCDYDACQGYPGADNEKPDTTRAVEATSGLALFHDGRPIDAVYSTNSGGITSAASDVWRGGDVSYLQSVRDFPSNSPLASLFRGGMNEGKWAQFVSQPFSSWAEPSGLKRSNYEARKYRWTQYVSAEEASRAFKMQGLLRVTQIEVERRAPSGRIRRIKVTGVDAERMKTWPTPSPNPTPRPEDSSWVGISFPIKSVVLEGDGAIRAMFSKQLGSKTALPSSLFVVSYKIDKSKGQMLGWTFTGAGWGHGVGLCQRGAQNHAKEGWDARRILAWYYRGVEIRQLTE